MDASTGLICALLLIGGISYGGEPKNSSNHEPPEKDPKITIALTPINLSGEPSVQESNKTEEKAADSKSEKNKDR
jgi:hypothetical protein